MLLLRPRAFTPISMTLRLTFPPQAVRTCMP